MKKKYCFLVDTSADPSIVNLNENIDVMHIHIVVTQNDIEKSYEDWKDIERTEVIQHMKDGNKVTTSQPTFGVTLEKMENLLNEYEQVIVLPISRNISGTYDSCIMAQKELEAKYGKNRILVVDSKGISYLQQDILLLVKSYLDKGLSLDEINEKVKYFEDKYCCITIVNSPTQLISGGRLKGLKAIFVKALNLKLLIKFQNGKLDFNDKAKTWEQSIDKAVESLNKELNFSKNKIKCVHIFADLDNVNIDELDNYTKEKFKPYYTGEFCKGKLPSTIIAHLGPSSYTLFVDIE
ncbi:MAG: DegV family protein [Mycoplasma sp.]